MSRKLGVLIISALVTVGTFFLMKDTTGGTLNKNLADAQQAYERKNFEAARRLFEAAAAEGSAVAAFQLGVMYENGEGGAPDPTQSLEWYVKAADLGSSAGAKNAGNMYYDGKVVPKDIGKAIRFYQLAGQLGDSNSLFLVGQIYLLGADEYQDHAKATAAFLTAAGMGNAPAMNALGISYRLGSGVTQNDAAAYAYFKLAGEYGSKIGKSNLDELSKIISSAVKESGEQLFKALKENVQPETVKQSQ